MKFPVRLLTVAMLVGGLAGQAKADINGFNNGTGWVANTNGNTFATPFSGSTLTITDTNGGEAHSVWFNQAQNLTGVNGGFTASFTYQATMGGGSNNPDSAADGFTFVIQKATNSTSALGDGGGFLGYSRDSAGGFPGANSNATIIQNSVALEVNIFPPNSPNGSVTGTQLETNGKIAGPLGQFADANGGQPGNNGTITPYNGTTPLNLANGDQYSFSLVYNGTTLTETIGDITNPSTNEVFTYTINIPSIVGGTTGLVGFTGGTGADFSLQQIGSFTFDGDPQDAPPPSGPSAAPEPASLTLIGISAASMLGYTLRRRKAGAVAAL